MLLASIGPLAEVGSTQRCQGSGFLPQCSSLPCPSPSSVPQCVLCPERLRAFPVTRDYATAWCVTVVSLCHTHGAEPTGVTSALAAVAWPQQGCPHLRVLLFCSSLNFLLLGSEPRHPRGDSMQTGDCGCQRNTPITGPIRAPLLLAPGNPSRSVPLGTAWFS